MGFKPKEAETEWSLIVTSNESSNISKQPDNPFNKILKIILIVIIILSIILLILIFS